MPQMNRLFRILTFSGGGVRGIFQAVYLARISKTFPGPLYKYFDLICGTSTGAIVAAAVACDISPEVIVDAYRKYSAKVFTKRFAGSILGGGKYDTKQLKILLQEVFAERTLADAKTELLITATSLDTYSHRIFTTLDGKDHPDTKVPLADVVRASASAPTYFLPTNPKGSNRAYVDGGMWANAPTIAALLHVHYRFGVSFNSMRVLSIGNGKRPPGTTINQFSQLRAFSVSIVEHLIDLMFSSQESFSDEMALHLVGPENFLLVNVPLDEEVRLDNAKLALEKLPPLAEKIADETSSRFGDLFALPSNKGGAKFSPASSRLVPRFLVAAAGLTAIYPTRAYYSHRRETHAISAYIETAKSSITMVSVNLMTGIPYENLARTIKAKLVGGREIGFQVIVSLLNPTRQHLIQSLAPVLKVKSDRLARMIHDHLDNLLLLREKLPDNIRDNLSIRVHNAIPFASAIILDGEAQDGRIQVETKAYAIEHEKSFAIEVMRTGEEGSLYENLLEGCPLHTS